MALKLNNVANQQQAQLASRRRVPIIWPWVIVIAAWTLSLVAVLTNQTELIDHRYLLQQSHLPWLLALLIFLACWQITILAMMLPSSMPMLYIMVYAGRKQGRPQTIPLLFLAGYAAIWTAFALVAFILDTQLHLLVAHWFWLYMHPWLIGAVTFALAGAFQFSPLKARCLQHCRSRFHCFARHSHNHSRKGTAAWHLGLRHGLFCLGGCWALMLIMFGLGVGSLIWMAVLTAVMLIEKTFPGGHRLTPIIGLVLLLLAALWLAHPTWLLVSIV